jgi:hypothetical protein
MLKKNYVKIIGIKTYVVQLKMNSNDKESQEQTITNLEALISTISASLSLVKPKLKESDYTSTVNYINIMANVIDKKRVSNNLFHVEKLANMINEYFKSFNETTKEVFRTTSPSWLFTEDFRLTFTNRNNMDVDTHSLPICKFYNASQFARAKDNHLPERFLIVFIEFIYEFLDENAQMFCKLTQDQLKVALGEVKVGGNTFDMSSMKDMIGDIAKDFDKDKVKGIYDELSSKYNMNEIKESPEKIGNLLEDVMQRDEFKGLFNNMTGKVRDMFGYDINEEQLKGITSMIGPGISSNKETIQNMISTFDQSVDTTKLTEAATKEYDKYNSNNKNNDKSNDK